MSNVRLPFWLSSQQRQLQLHEFECQLPQLLTKVQTLPLGKK